MSAYFVEWEGKLNWSSTLDSKWRGIIEGKHQISSFISSFFHIKSLLHLFCKYQCYYRECYQIGSLLLLQIEWWQDYWRSSFRRTSPSLMLRTCSSRTLLSLVDWREESPASSLLEYHDSRAKTSLNHQPSWLDLSQPTYSWETSVSSWMSRNPRSRQTTHSSNLNHHLKLETMMKKSSESSHEPKVYSFKSSKGKLILTEHPISHNVSILN